MLGMIAARSGAQVQRQLDHQGMIQGTGREEVPL